MKLAQYILLSFYSLFSKSFCVNKSKKVKIAHIERVKITTVGVPSKNVDAEPLTISAIKVDNAPITDDAYPAMCPKGFIAKAFKLPKINPKKEKLTIIKIENHVKLNERLLIWFIRLIDVQIINSKEKVLASLTALNCPTYLEFKYDDRPSMEAISAKYKGNLGPTSK